MHRQLYRHSLLLQILYIYIYIDFPKARGHAGLNDVILHILEFCQTPPDAAHRPHREKAERKWQFRLRSNFPYGMNKEDATPLAQ